MLRHHIFEDPYAVVRAFEARRWYISSLNKILLHWNLRITIKYIYKIEMETVMQFISIPDAKKITYLRLQRLPPYFIVLCRRKRTGVLSYNNLKEMSRIWVFWRNYQVCDYIFVQCTSGVQNLNVATLGCNWTLV